MEKIIVPAHIYREFVQAHPEWNFVYGNDYYKRCMLGQAWYVGGEKNSFSVPTVEKYCSNPAYFHDGQFARNCKWIDEQIADIPRDKPIIVLPKIGRGCSRMAEFAPKCYLYLIDELGKIVHKNIEVRYT